MTEPLRITSKANPLLMRLRRLAADPAGYRRAGMVWLEGDHLCAAAQLRGVVVAQAVVCESAWDDAGLRSLAGWAAKVHLLPDALYRSVSALESPSKLGFVLELPSVPTIDARAATVVLDRLQDAGNVGSILRSAAALGVSQVLALRGTAALWSPKVLRAGMGAHFALRLAEGLEAASLDTLKVPLLATSSHAGSDLHATALPRPCAWVLGHEGQGVAEEISARCTMQLRIVQPGGEESMNVAAAAAICLYESLRQAQ